MRITCPNCNAQYEIGDDLIPSEGRDVQCSNCGTTWFQAGRGRAVSAAEARAIRRPATEAKAEAKPAEDAPGPADSTDAPATGDVATRETQSDEARSEAAARAATPSRHRRPAADDATLDILREEREREERLRKSGTGPAVASGSHDDDDVDAEDPRDPRAQAAAERMRMAAAATQARPRDDAARPATGGTGAEAAGDRDEGSRKADGPRADRADDDRADNGVTNDGATNDAAQDDHAASDDLADDGLAEEAPPSTGVATARPTRRELLPDIEEINSSLRPDERAAEAEALANAEAKGPEMAKRSSGFRTGFMLVSVLVLGAVSTYVFADQIGVWVPALADTLASYVVWVDAQRIALAAAAEALTEQLAPVGN